jgi:hypothetical protein
MSLEEASALLMAACEDAVAGTIKEALAAFGEKLESPLESWIVAEPIDLLMSSKRLTLGTTTYARDMPRAVAPRRVLAQAETYGLRAPVRFVTVRARDQTAAKILAAERFAESLALLNLISRQGTRVGHATTTGRNLMLRHQDGRWSISLSRKTWIVRDELLDDRGRLVPPYLQLSRAATRAEDKRSDWQRRVLAAVRWYSKSADSEWPADRLASLMVALECLFVESRREQQKGSKIAERLTERFRLNDKSATEQLKWLEGLYASRNDAIHEGRDFLDDLEIDRLSELTRFVIRHLAEHLAPGHRRPGRSCRTFEQVMRCSKP